MDRSDLERLARDWPVFSLPAQRPPLGQWRTWLLLGGRGAGKTRMGAQWLKGIVSGDPHFEGDPAGRVALVGETYADARTVMIEGESGLLAAHSRAERPVWISGKRELVWPSGVIGQVFSANDPEGLRGSQFGAAWCDEIAKWAHPQETWDMLQFCMRLGSDPRQVATTTPKPLKLFARLLAEPTTAVTHSPTSANITNLAPGFVDLHAELGEPGFERRETLDHALAAAAHTQEAAYLDAVTRDEWNPHDYAYHLSRRARGLPFWFSLAANGTDAYRDAVEATLTVTRRVAAEISARGRLELVLEPELSVVLFRRLGWVRADYDEWADRALADQRAFVRPTSWRGEPVMRFCFVNPRTTVEMVRPLLDSMLA